MIKHGHPSYYFAVKMKDDVLGSKMAAFWSYFKTLVKLVYRMRTGRSQEKTTHGRVLALTMRKTRVVPGLQNTKLLKCRNCNVGGNLRDLGQDSK